MSAPFQTPTRIPHGGLPAATQMDTSPSGLLHELERLGLSSRSLDKYYHSTSRGVIQGIVYRFCQLLQEATHEHSKSATTQHNNYIFLQTSLRNLWNLWSDFSAVQELSFLNLAHSPMTFNFDAVCVKLVAPSDSSIGVARKFGMWRARARELATGMKTFVRALLEAHVQTREGEKVFQHIPDYHIPDEEKGRIEKAMETFMSEGSVDADLVSQSWSLRRCKEDDEEKHGEREDDREEEEDQEDNEENDREDQDSEDNNSHIPSCVTEEWQSFLPSQLSPFLSDVLPSGEPARRLLARRMKLPLAKDAAAQAEAILESLRKAMPEGSRFQEY